MQSKGGKQNTKQKQNNNKKQTYKSNQKRYGLKIDGDGLYMRRQRVRANEANTKIVG